MTLWQPRRLLQAFLPHPIHFCLSPQPTCTSSSRADTGCVLCVGYRMLVQVSQLDESLVGFFGFVFIPFHNGKSFLTHTDTTRLILTVTSIKLHCNHLFICVSHPPLLLTPCQQGQLCSHDSPRAKFLEHTRSSMNEWYNEQRMNCDLALNS